ncbi:hypothetical protein Tco_0694056 [Tanacetum coccineum]
MWRLSDGDGGVVVVVWQWCRCDGGGVEMWQRLGLVMEREATAGVCGVVKAAVMEAAVEVAAGCGSGG